MTGVSFRNVTKRFGKVLAVGDLDLEIEPGEFVSLLGPSGSGKTTSLNLLAGLESVDEGGIWIGEREVTDLTPDKRDLAMVFQNYALYPHMTVFENLAFPLRAKGRRFAEDEIERRIQRSAAMLGIGELLGRFPKELSGGQQQRVALGRAIVRDPQVFLLDEPLSNLDARLRIRMRHDLKKLHDELGSTIVYVTHDQAEAMTLSSRIAVFSQGRLQQYANPGEIYNRPANLFVANFVGDREINLVDGRVTGNGHGLRFEAPGLTFPLEDAFAPARDRAVVLGIRPEGLRLAMADEPGAMPGEVTQTELIGPDLVVFARVGGSELCARTDPRLEVRKRQGIWLVPEAGRVHLFDPTSQAALRQA
jgi:ABC-type sugar transport system ATPase subunit